MTAVALSDERTHRADELEVFLEGKEGDTWQNSRNDKLWLEEIPREPIGLEIPHTSLVRKEEERASMATGKETTRKTKKRRQKKK